MAARVGMGVALTLLSKGFHTVTLLPVFAAALTMLWGVTTTGLTAVCTLGVEVPADVTRVLAVEAVPALVERLKVLSTVGMLAVC